MNTTPKIDVPWPKTADGTIDWEIVFEDPKGGLLSLIRRAKTPEALLNISVLIIRKIYTRKDDPEQIEQFVQELTELIPPDLPVESLSLVNQVVIDLLRQIKDFRIQKAAEHVAKLAAAKALKISAEQDKADRYAQARTFFIPSQKTKRTISYGTLALAIAAIGVFIYFLSADKPRVPDEQADILVSQMEAAIRDNKSGTHVFEGELKIGRQAGKTNITATHVPKKSCFYTVRRLLSKGNVSINESYPRKISPTIITILCTRGGPYSSLTFFPKK